MRVDLGVSRSTGVEVPLVPVVEAVGRREEKPLGASKVMPVAFLAFM